MADTDLQISLTADSSELTAAAASWQSTLEGVSATVRQVNTQFASMTGPKTASRDAQDFQRAWESSITSVTRSFARGLVQMGEGSKSFGQVMASIGNQIAMKFADVVAKIVSDWIIAETTKTTASQAGFVVRSAYDVQAAEQSRSSSFLAAQKVALNNAVQAASGAYASASSIPLVGWLIAPGAAAAAFAAVEAFGALTSAAGGYDIPAGVNPLVQAHASEMILPASIANPLRAQLASASFGGASAQNAGSGGGDTHIHNWHLHGVMDGASLRRVLEANRSDHAAAMESLVRTRNGRGFGG